MQFWSNPSNKSSATWCHLSALLGPSCLRVATLTSFLPSCVSAAGAPAVKDLNEPLVDATICVYSTITSQLLPTPAKSHYTFNLRDLSKVFQGMLMAESSNIEVSPLSSTVVLLGKNRNVSVQTQFPVETVFLYCSMNLVMFPLVISPSTGSTQTTPSLPWCVICQVRGHGESVPPSLAIHSCRAGQSRRGPDGTMQGQRFCPAKPTYTNGGFCPFSSPVDLAL